MTMLFNPYTGKPRHPSDIRSDPQGLLIVEPGAPLLAATPACGCRISECESKPAGCRMAEEVRTRDPRAM
jgi:hypothetical protein